MGWASGSEVMSGIIRTAKRHVPDEKTRVLIYRDIVDVLRDRDWDTLNECCGEDPAYDIIYNEIYPDSE